MRVSTSTVFDANVASMTQNQSKLLHTQQQVSAGRRILSPADDPVGATRALELAQSDGAITQYAKNIDAVENSLVLSESTLGTVSTLLQDLQVLAVNAGNTKTLNNSDRKTLAETLQGRLDQLVSLANSTDGIGNYLFSGFQGKVEPFVKVAAGPTSPVQYNGDDGQRLNQVNANRQLASSDSGADVFMRIKNGNGTFVTKAVPTNVGSGIASLGSVVNPAALLPGSNYQVTFTVAAGVTTYTVTGTDDQGAAVPGLPAAQPYISGQAISFRGMQFDIQGAPANGDQFTVAPSSNESMFKTISDLINTLNMPVTDAASDARLRAGVSNALEGFSRSLDKTLTVRASIGSRLQEMDSLRVTGDDLSLQYKQALSLLQDVDYTKALTDLSQQKAMLEAAQKSFLAIENLSVFNYMP